MTAAVSAASKSFARRCLINAGILNVAAEPSNFPTVLPKIFAPLGLGPNAEGQCHIDRPGRGMDGTVRLGVESQSWSAGMVKYRKMLLTVVGPVM